MRLQIDNQSLPVKNLDTGRLRDVAELQTQTGWKLKQLREQIDANDSISAAVLVFLTLRYADIPTTWDEVLYRGFDEIAVVRDLGDTRGQEDEQPDPPQTAADDSSPDTAEQAEEWPPTGE